MSVHILSVSDDDSFYNDYFSTFILGFVVKYTILLYTISRFLSMSVKTIKYFTKFNADYAKQVFFRLSSLSKNQFSVEILTKKNTMVMVEPLSLWFLNLFFHSKFTVYFIIYIYSMLTACNKMSFAYGKIKKNSIY